MTSFRSLLASAALALCSAARADGFVNVYDIPLGVSANVIGNMHAHEILNRHIGHWDAHSAKLKREKADAARRGAAPRGSVAHELASQLPGHQAKAGEAAYRQAYDYHEQVIKKFGLPSGDLGVGIASSIAGAWMAYHNKPFPDQFYLPLVRQMRQRVEASAPLRALPAAERGAAYEALAITGMMLASSQISWERNPRAAGAADLLQRMRSEGGTTLTRMLQMPPDQVGIGAQGVFTLAAQGR